MGFSNYPKIVFLSHSMGGLVTRAYLLKNRNVGDHTFFAYFFSTPTTGSQIASIAQYLSSNPQFVKMKSLNAEDYLADLLRQWLAAGFSFPSYCAYEKRPTKGVSLVVDMGSAVALCTKAVDPIDADHIGIVKPTSPNSAPYIAFKAAYTDPNLAAHDHLEGKNMTGENFTQPPVNIGGGGNIVTFGQSGGQNVINQAPKPDLKTLNNDIRQNPDGSQTISILTEVVAPYPSGSLLIKAAAPDILDFDVIPRHTGVSISGHSGQREGYAFTTLMSPFGTRTAPSPPPGTGQSEDRKAPGPDRKEHRRRLLGGICQCGGRGALRRRGQARDGRPRATTSHGVGDEPREANSPASGVATCPALARRPSAPWRRKRPMMANRGALGSRPMPLNG
jgi:hypothetical protein